MQLQHTHTHTYTLIYSTLATAYLSVFLNYKVYLEWWGSIEVSRRNRNIYVVTAQLHRKKEYVIVFLSKNKFKKDPGNKSKQQFAATSS